MVDPIVSKRPGSRTRRWYWIVVSCLVGAAVVVAVVLVAVLARTGHHAGITTASPKPTSPRSTSGAVPDTLTIGSGSTPESVLLADIYGDAMSAKGVRIVKKLQLSSRTTYLTQLRAGTIGAVIDYSGSSLDFLDIVATAKSPEDVEAALKTAAAAQGLVPLDYAPAQDSDTITVTQATAAKDHLTTIGDLASVAGKLTLGAPAGFPTRADGIPALKSTYGVIFGKFAVFDAGGARTVQALKGGTIGAADIPSTDGSIAANDFVPLVDDMNMFTAQNIVPIFQKSELTPTMARACNAVSAKLDTTTLASLDAQVAAGDDPDAVARAWLISEGLS